MTSTASSASRPDETEREPPMPGARLAEELRLMVDALAERAQPWLNRLATGDPAGETGDGRWGADWGADHAREHAKHIPATCEWCPVCAGLALMRGERPELAARAAEHAAGLLAVLRSALADPEPSRNPTNHEPAASASEADAEPGQPAARQAEQGQTEQGQTERGQAEQGQAERGQAGSAESSPRVQRITVRRRERAGRAPAAKD